MDSKMYQKKIIYNCKLLLLSNLCLLLLKLINSNSNSIVMVYWMMLPVELNLIMVSLLLDMVLIIILIIGLLETHGDPNGDSKDISKSKEITHLLMVSVESHSWLLILMSDLLFFVLTL